MVWKTCSTSGPGWAGASTCVRRYWEDRRANHLLRRTYADQQPRRACLLRRQQHRCAITGLPLEDMAAITLQQVALGHDVASDGGHRWCLVLRWAQAALRTRLKVEQRLA